MRSCVLALVTASLTAMATDWPSPGGGPSNARYSPLKQIHRGNVARLQLAWKYDLDHEPSAGPVCTDCGILVPRPVLTPDALADARRGRLLMTA